MNILALDQARNGAWAVYNSDSKELISYGSFCFDVKSYTYPQAIMYVEQVLAMVSKTYDVEFVALEDIQLRMNAQGFKKLAQLQGVLVNYCEVHKLNYEVVHPTIWQNSCKKALAIMLGVDPKNLRTLKTKELSKLFIKHKFDIHTDNDNIADAICIGWFCLDEDLHQKKISEVQTAKKERR